MQVQLSSIVEGRLRVQAQQRGLEPESYASQLIEDAVADSHLEDPIRQRFQESGMSEDELGELLEAEKHEARRDRHSSLRP